MFEFFLVLALWIVCGVVGGSVTRSKGRGGAAGFLLGVLLGPVGLLIALILPRNEQGLEAEALESGNHRRCPSCAELVRREAVKCRWCGADLEPLAPVLPDPPAPVSTDRMVAAALVIGVGVLLTVFVFAGAKPPGDPYGLEENR